MIALLLAPDQAVERDISEDPLHIVREEESDPDADYWVMYCGLVVRAFDDGSLSPNIDFYHANAGEKADCKPCKAAWGQ